MLKLACLTALALVAFAANSVLCRLALGEGLIDAGSFTVIRLLSGVLALFLVISMQQKLATPSSYSKSSKGSWSASMLLFIYAAAFSYAYTSLDTGTGALILFGAVQITMILMTVYRGYRLSLLEWLGLLLSFIGFIYLMLPSATSAPSALGFVLMMLSGVAWGFYTLKGSDSKSPLLDTGYNFLRTVPLALLLLAYTFPSANYTATGVAYAVLSGAVASGLGYTIWYMALGSLQSIQAAVLQLLVPVIAALGGILFVAEPITARLLVSASLVLGGILLVMLKRT
ncbi:MAG: DMT family transporter [Ghiorsea sp.]